MQHKKYAGFSERTCELFEFAAIQYGAGAEFNLIATYMMCSATVPLV